MTIYSACNGAQVFSTRSMLWTWGLDGFGAIDIFDEYRVNPAAEQMTHNLLRTFSGKPTSPVIFTNADSITSGNWTNVYGSSGYWIADTTTRTNLPSYAQVTLSNQQVLVWTNVTTDTRALLQPANYTNRIAAAWTTTTNQGSSFTIDLNLASGHTNQIALNCVDWSGAGTVLERIEVFDYADFSHPLDTRDFQLPANGVYLVWKLSGHKLIRITKPDSTSETKAMVSALFMGD